MKLLVAKVMILIDIYSLFSRKSLKAKPIDRKYKDRQKGLFRKVISRQPSLRIYLSVIKSTIRKILRLQAGQKGA